MAMPRTKVRLMGSGVSFPSTGRFGRILLPAVLLIDLFVAGIVALSLAQDLVRERRDAEAATQNLSQVLEESLVGLIGRIDLTLLAVRDEVQRQAAAGAVDPAAIDAVLARHDARLPDTLGLRIADAQGIIRHAVTGVVVSQASIADRPQFIRVPPVRWWAGPRGNGW